MLSTSSLTFHYNAGRTFTFPDVHCDKGEHLLILGESGRGKTTLLHLIAGMLRPASGYVKINGTSINTLAGAALDKFRGESVGIIFQTSHFVESLSVADNLLLPQYLTAKKITREKAQTTLARLGLAEMMNMKPGNLSVGEQQRVAIARAVMNNPSVILADEPTSALDDKNAEEVIRLLEEQARETAACLVIVTHDKRLKDKFSKQIVL